MEHFNAERYQSEVNARMPRSKTFRACLRAFWTGGLICVIGQLVSDTLQYRCRLPE